MAVGLTVEKKYIPLLWEKLNDLAIDFCGEEGPPTVFYADLQIEPEEINPELVRALDLLEPFGFGNERPFFYGKEWLLRKKRGVGKKLQHLQLGLQKNNLFFPGISFNGKNKFPFLNPFQEIDLVFSLSFDRWRGGDNLQLEIHDCISYDVHSKDNYNIIDVRGLGRKDPYIENLISPNEAIIVFLNTVARRKNLEKIFAGRTEVIFSHQGELPSEVYGVPRHVVIYDLPLADFKLKKLLAHFSQIAEDKPGLQVHLIYNSEDFQENLKLLRSTVPAFSTLEQIYFFLQKLLAGGDPVKNISLDRFFNKLGRMLPFAVTKHLLRKSIELLQEAGYLELSDKGILLKRRSSDYCSFLKGIAGVKSFCEEREKWKQTFSYQHFMLVAPGRDILYSLSDFTLGAT